MIFTLVLIFLLSAVSLWFVAHLLRKPYRPELQLMSVPALVADTVPDATPDWIGLV